MRAFAFLILFLYLPAFAAAQCEEAQPGEMGGAIKKIHLTTRADSETALSMTASAAGTSWQTKGAEAAVVTVFVDGKYSQDVILFSGSRVFKYQVLLGRLDGGKHEIAVFLNTARSAPNARSVTIHSLQAFPAVTAAKTRDRLAIANTPFIYARPNSVDGFSDIPLVVYYEMFPEPYNRYRIRYTVIFSNEDGGTEPAALMARWGRLTDIEWIYEIEVKDDQIVKEIFQGPDHVTMPFRGDRLGSHPVIFDTSDNNMFSDKGCSALRFAPWPQSADLSNRSRESVMDRNPWTYQIMAEEAFREGRVDADKTGRNTVDDPRRYLYVNVYAENNLTAVAIEAETVDKKTSRSDLGDPELRDWQTGFSRVAVRMPADAARLAALKLSCHTLPGFAVSGKCKNARIVGFLRLDKYFDPIAMANPDTTSHSLLPEEKIVWMIFKPKGSGVFKTLKRQTKF